ncbi:hypothetical protein LPTSP3_g24070 [Leptospira kobayashii]|uniref:PPM-type phosphatase domain-containing protein n=1 Tax=Leptospira kobayashii TaxID=1917830 RepID=A0ABM7UKP6_9LEPT|nr:SpoIIE family protein phosphatase [Leptospira kobayashii]BDA79477.1 hypothetical protein LPTSP3_g24070 [Leptospira kobayashii]
MNFITFFKKENLYFLGFIFVLLSCHPLEKTRIIEDWRFGWEMRWLEMEEIDRFSVSEENQSKSYLPYRIPYISITQPHNKILVARRKWEKLQGIESPSLFLRGGVRLLGIFSGNQLVARQFYFSSEGTETEGKKKLEFDPNFFPIVHLPKENAGEYIYVLFLSERNFPIGFNETPVYSDLISNHKMMTNRNQSFAGLGFFFISLGVFSSYLYWRRKKRAIVGFTIFSVLSGLHFMSQIGFWGFFWYDSFAVDFYIFIITLFSIPISGLYFFDKLFGIGRWNIIRMMWQFHLLFSIVILTLAFFDVIPFALALITFAWVTLPSLVLQVLISWGEIAAGKPKAWILALGSVFLLIFNGHDILVAMNVLQSITKLAPWGFFLFVVLLSLYGENLFRDSEVKFVSLQKEIVTAARIQNAILPPSPPKWENINISVYYQPSQEVGGDFYDFQALGNKKYGLLIADVVGHGLGASIVASLSKFSFFQNHNYWENPSFLLSSMNDDLVKRSQGRFTTASYFYLDRERKRFIVASAGHPSFFHLAKKDGSINEIKPKGKPLGILENLTFVEEEYNFEPGDRFLFYTDGLTEETGKGEEEFGIQNLKILFNQFSNLLPDLAVAKMVAEFKSTMKLQGLPHDDITLIVLEVC